MPKDVDIIRDNGGKSNYHDLSKPSRDDRKNPFSEKNVLKEEREDFKDTTFDPDMRVSKIAFSVCCNYIYDKKHVNVPQGSGWHKTDCGWSDVSPKPKGEASLSRFIQNNPNVFGDVIFQKRIRMYVDKTIQQSGEVIAVTEEVFEKNEQNSNCRMRIDAVLKPKALPVPIYVEFDEGHHFKGEQNRKDRVKDFHCRLQESAIVARLNSDNNSAQKLESIYNKLLEHKNEFGNLFSEDKNSDEFFASRSKAQEYVDSLCYAYADNQFNKVSSISVDDCIDFVSDKIVADIREIRGDKGIGREQRKLLSIWCRRLDDFKDFISVIGNKSKRKGVVRTILYNGKTYHPYNFIKVVLRKLKQ